MIGFHEIYQKYAPQVQRFTFWLCGDEEEARDLTAETFVRLWTHRGTVRTATVKGYLFAIAHNLFRQWHRKNQRRQDMPEDVVATAPGPEQIARARSQMDTTIAALQQLPADDRAALILRAHQGLTYDDIAQCLGITVVAARVKVHRARIKLTDLTNQKEGRSHGNQP
jgi:RNA polymerase sigma-70 factor (ECF subfamily)